MDNKKHFESYRGSVIQDSLDGYAEFAKTQDYEADHGFYPSFKGSMHEYLRECVAHIQNAIEKGSDYFFWIGHHKRAVLALFERLVEAEIAKSQKPREEAILDLAYSKGMKWLKFSDFVLTFDKFTLIPRFDDKFDFKNSDQPIITADELGLILGTNSKTMANEAINGKLAQQAHGEFCKIVAWVPHGFEWQDINKINQNAVLDWTLPLGE